MLVGWRWGREERGISPRFLALVTMEMMVPLTQGYMETGLRAQFLLRKLTVQFWPW